MPYQAWIVLIGLGALGVLVWYVKRENQRVNDALEALGTAVKDSEIKETSSALREAAIAVRTAGGGYLDDRVSTTPLPNGDYRD